MLIPYSAQNTSEPGSIRAERDIGSSRHRLGDAVRIEQEQTAPSQRTEGAFRVSGVPAICGSHVGSPCLAFGPCGGKETSVGTFRTFAPPRLHDDAGGIRNPCRP